MKWIVPAVVIGLVGGILDDRTDLNKVWCFLIGVGVFLVFLLIKSIITTVRIMRSTKNKKMSKIQNLRAQLKQYEENERDLMMCIVALNEAFREKLIPETREQEQALHDTLATMRKVLDRRDKYKYGL